MKLLILSHNPLTTYESMGKTLSSLLSAFGKEELCQLYIYPTVPNMDICSSLYRITDKDVLKSYLRFKVKGGKTVPDLTQSSMFEHDGDEKLYRSPKNKKPAAMLARDLMWKCARWFNKDLRAWLDAQKPDCILAAPGSAKFFYDMALKISKAYNIPIISYLCDEFYFVKTPEKFGERIRVGLLQRKIEKYMSKVSKVITICDELKTLYEKKFSVPVTTVMTASSFPVSEEVRVKDNPKAITFMGNVRCGRYKSIAEIGNALKEINKKTDSSYKIKVYCSEKNREILSTLRSCETVELCGFVTGEEFEKTLHSADFLLHTEAFEEGYAELVKNSVSTKIADSLGSGVPLIAYGPKEVASMGHLIRNNCAIAITEKDALVPMLERAFSDKEYVKSLAKKGLEAALKYHDPEKCKVKVREIIESVL